MVQFPRSSPSSRRSKVGGFTLVEILVSFVVFAFGMLGAAGLQIWSLKSSQQSQNHAVAASLVRDYAELMLAIPDSVFSSQLSATAVVGSVTNPYFFDYKSTDIEALTSGTAPDACFGTVCTASKFGEAAIRDWLKRLNVSLPKVRVKVCTDSQPADSDGVYRWACDGVGKMTAIKLRWDLRTSADATGEQLAALSLADGESSAETSVAGNKPPVVVVLVPGSVEDTYDNQ